MYREVNIVFLFKFGSKFFSFCIFSLVMRVTDFGFLMLFFNDGGFYYICYCNGF